MDENRLFGVWENALLLSLQLEQTSQEAHQSLEELASLVVSLGAKVADRIIQNRPQIHPAYFLPSTVCTYSTARIMLKTEDTQ